MAQTSHPIIPDQSACLECSLRVETVAKTIAAHEQRAQCGLTPEPSIVTSNALAGALMAHQIRATLCGHPARGVITYDAKVSRNKLGVRSVQAPCRCHHKKQAA